MIASKTITLITVIIICGEERANTFFVSEKDHASFSLFYFGHMIRCAHKNKKIGEEENERGNVEGVDKLRREESIMKS